MGTAPVNMRATISYKKVVRDLFTLVQFLREQVKLQPQTPPLSVAQLQALTYIGKHKMPLMREVADFLVMAPPSATSLVSTLLARKLVVRATDATDKRAVRLRLTVNGKRLLARRVAAVSRALSNKCKMLTNAEQVAFARILNSICY